MHIHLTVKDWIAKHEGNFRNKHQPGTTLSAHIWELKDRGADSKRSVIFGFCRQKASKLLGNTQSMRRWTHSLAVLQWTGGDHLLYSWCSSFFFTLSLSDADCFSTWLEFILPDDFGRRRVCEAWWHHWKADIRGGENAQWLAFILLQCHLEPKHTYKKTPYTNA